VEHGHPIPHLFGIRNKSHKLWTPSNNTSTSFKTVARAQKKLINLVGS
jgi:hypothetical protein